MFFIAGNNPSVVQSILNERCDGNRNIFHAVVSMCSPTSNKESDNGMYLKIAASNSASSNLFV